MPSSRSAGIIFYRDEPPGRVYLVLRSTPHPDSKKEFWDIPKGELDEGEDALAAARREAREEAGLEKFEIVPDFKHTARYFTRRDGKSIPKFVAVFLAKSEQETITLSWEHDQYAWLRYEEARIRLTTMRQALEEAEVFLTGPSA